MPFIPSLSALKRRDFLKAGAAGAATLFLPSWLSALPHSPSVISRMGQPVRIRGAVRLAGSGLGGVSVSDGLEVVRTDSDGSFEMVTTDDRDFVRLCVPSGCRIPQNQAGTARFYQPILPGSAGEMEAVFELEPLEGSDENHAAFLLADIQVENAQEMTWFQEQTVPDIQATLSTLGNPVAVGMSDGDIMFDHLELFSDYEGAVAEMGMPFFQIPGNHDLNHDRHTDQGTTDTFSTHFGPAYYSFDRGAVHYVVLDDVFWHGSGYMGYLNTHQLRWLENDLSFVEAGRPVLVAAHIPILGSRHLRTGDRHPAPGLSVANRQALYDLLQPYQAHILTAHTHEHEHVFEGGTHEHVHGAVCGAWWSGPICADGTPQGYSVYELRGEEVTWRHKATGPDFDYQLRAYARGADPAAPDEIVANVWDWDPEWTVIWYEDGERRGEMVQRVGTDPLSEELLRGDRLPAYRPSVDPYPTNHLLYAQVSADVGEVRVEATDRFGRVYSATAR